MEVGRKSSALLVCSLTAFLAYIAYARRPKAVLPEEDKDILEESKCEESEPRDVTQIDESKAILITQGPIEENKSELEEEIKED